MQAAPCGTSACLRVGSKARLPPRQQRLDLLVEFEDLQPTDLVEAYFGLEQQLTESMGHAIDLVMADAVRNPFVRADIEASKQLIYGVVE